MKRIIVLLILSLAILPASGEVYIDVTPGSSDGFFDGSDHQTSGIDVWIDAPDFGSIPMPGPPEPVPYEFDEYRGKSNEILESVASPARRAAITGRRIAIVYRDSTVQYVELKQDFARVARLSVLPEVASDSVLALFVGRWNSPWGRMTITRQGAVLSGSGAHRGFRMEAAYMSGRTIEGTWSERGGRSGRIILAVSDDGRTFSGRRFQGLNRDGVAVRGTKAVR